MKQNKKRNTNKYNGDYWQQMAKTKIKPNKYYTGEKEKKG